MTHRGGREAWVIHCLPNATRQGLGAELMLLQSMGQAAGGVRCRLSGVKHLHGQGHRQGQDQCSPAWMLLQQQEKHDGMMWTGGGGIIDMQRAYQQEGQVHPKLGRRMGWP